MKNWIVRVGSLYVFNVVVLLLIGALLPRVWIGWATAWWAAVILTAATIWVKPVVLTFMRSAAERTSTELRRGREKLIEYATVFVVALVVWIIVLFLSPARAWGFVGIILPPLMLLVAWFVYDMIDDRLEKVAGTLYDRAEAAMNSHDAPQTRPPAAPESAQTQAARDELKDGLTPEQRRMMDGL